MSQPAGVPVGESELLRSVENACLSFIKISQIFKDKGTLLFWTWTISSKPKITLRNHLAKFSPCSSEQFTMEAGSKKIKGKGMRAFLPRKSLSCSMEVAPANWLKPSQLSGWGRPRFHCLFFLTLSLLNSTFSPSSSAGHHMWSVYQDYIM